MATLFALAVNNLVNHIPLSIPMTGDYLMIVATGSALALFVWGFYAKRP
jgi:hypothetical protein